MSDESLLRLVAASAVVLAALVGTLLGFFAQKRLKRYEMRAQALRDRAARRRALHVPLLRFCYELDSRIGRILSMLHEDWLSATYLERFSGNDGFAKDQRQKGYFIVSSVYLFSCFFGWTEAIQRGVDETNRLAEQSALRRWLSRKIRELIAAWRRKGDSAIYFFDRDIHIVRRLFQHQELFDAYSKSKKLSNPRDSCKLHRHLQHSIGEMMLQRDGEVLRCKTFREFVEAYHDEKFRYWFALLEDLFVDLSGFPVGKDIETQAEMRNDVRPLRLLAIRYWCRILMKNMASDLGIEAPPPEAVLQDVSESLRSTIAEVRVENVEPFLVGISQAR